jgi:hypothetical protein
VRAITNSKLHTHMRIRFEGARYTGFDMNRSYSTCTKYYRTHTRVCDIKESVMASDSRQRVLQNYGRGGAEDRRGRMEIKSNGTRKRSPEYYLTPRSEDEDLSVIATSGDLLTPWTITGPYQTTGPTGRVICL